MATLRRLPGILLFVTSLTAWALRANAYPHYIVKKDLRVDLSMPSLGVVLSQMLQHKTPQRDQRSPWQYDNTVPDGKVRSEAVDRQDTTVVGAYDDGGGAKAWTHRGRFGQDMTARTETVTFPTEHGHANAGLDRLEQVVLRRWQNLMEPRETPPADLVTDPTRPAAKPRRSKVDAAPFRTRIRDSPKLPPATTAAPSAVITSKGCNCTQLLTNETFSTVVFLVPDSYGTAGETGGNGSLIREIIRASLSKSVRVERIYEKGCRCGSVESRLPSSSTSTAATEAETAASVCVRNDSRGLKTMPVKRLPTTARAEKIASSAKFAAARMRLPERRPQTTMPSTAGRLGRTKCPVRVFVKLPGEELPVRAQECRKLWLPEIIYKEETFWECEDRGSADCRDRAPASGTRRALLARESGSFPRGGVTHIGPLTRIENMRKTYRTASKTATGGERTTPKCGSADDASLSTPECVRAASNESWHLSLRIPLYPSRSSSTRSTITRTTTPQYAAVAIAETVHSTSANATGLPPAWHMRCPQYGGNQGVSNSLAFMLMCAAAAAHGACSGGSCEPKKRLAEPNGTPAQRSTHYHLHDDYDYVWTRGTSATASRSLHYRARNGTAFPYPFRESHASPTNARRGGPNSTAARKGSSLERKAPIFREAEPSKPGAAHRKAATTETTTYIEIILGLAGPEGLSHRKRVTYNGPFADSDAADRNVELRRGATAQTRSLIGPRGQHGEADGERSRPPGKRAASIGRGDTASPPVISTKALVGTAQSSECKGARCAANSGEKSFVEKVVVRDLLPPSVGEEYAYYYVDDEVPSTEHSFDEQRYRSITSFGMVPAQSEELEREKREVRYKSQLSGGSIGQ